MTEFREWCSYVLSCLAFVSFALIPIAAAIAAGFLFDSIAGTAAAIIACCATLAITGAIAVGTAAYWVDRR